MNNSLMTSILCFSFLLVANAQKKPFIGTGDFVNKSFNYKNFDKVEIFDFDGKIDIEIGKSFSIEVKIDKSLEPLLQVSENQDDGTLSVSLQSNKNARLYLENNNTYIKITMPEASVIKHRGNTKININGIIGLYFRFENNGNGDAILKGTIDELDIKKSGNGTVYADKLIAKVAKISAIGNGNVVANAIISINAKGMGNGNIIQKGHAKFDAYSGVVGNGSVRYE